MRPSLHRRHVLELLAAGCTTALAGCGRGSTDGREQTGTTPDPAGTTSQTNEETPHGTSGPDERVKTTPPGTPALEPSGSWPQYRFDAGNTGANPDGTGVRDGEQYWRLRPSGTPTLVDGRAYNVLTSDDGTTFTRRRPGTFAIVGNPVPVGVGLGSPPLVDGDRAFLSNFAQVVCMSTAGDAIRWRGPEMDGVQGGPAVWNDLVVANSAGFKDVDPHVRGLDIGDGTSRWRYDTGAVSKSTPAVADGVAYITASNGLHAIDLETGDRVWVQDDVAGTWASPATDGERVYSMSRNPEREILKAVDAATGEVRWQHSTQRFDHEPPVVTDDRVYLDVAGGVVALAPEDGRELARLDGAGAPVGLVGSVLYSTRRGELHAHDVDTGDPLWYHQTESVQVSDTVGRTIYGVTPVDGAVYVSARDAMHGFGPSRG